MKDVIYPRKHFDQDILYLTETNTCFLLCCFNNISAFSMMKITRLTWNLLLVTTKADYFGARIINKLGLLEII